MPDNLPAPRYRIIERGGRLEVVDSATGARPPSAAERMAAHDAAHGHEALRFDRLVEREQEAAAPAAMPKPAPVPPKAEPTERPRAALAERASPWQDKRGSNRAQLAAQSGSEARARPSPVAQSGKARAEPKAPKGRQMMVTGKWWDAKGPRTISLGDAGRAKMANGFLTTLVIGFFVLMVLLIIQPILALIAGFALFRFGGTVLAPVGARIVDEAIRADGGS